MVVDAPCSSNPVDFHWPPCSTLRFFIIFSDFNSLFSAIFDCHTTVPVLYGIRQSLSGTGHCFDNARMESFFAALKKEKLYKDGAYKLTREEVKTMIFRYVFVYYNCVRIYTANPFGLPPVKYREWMDGWRRYR